MTGWSSAEAPNEGPAGGSGQGRAGDRQGEATGILGVRLAEAGKGTEIAVVVGIRPIGPADATSTLTGTGSRMSVKASEGDRGTHDRGGDGRVSALFDPVKGLSDGSLPRLPGTAGGG